MRRCRLFVLTAVSVLAFLAVGLTPVAAAANPASSGTWTATGSAIGGVSSGPPSGVAGQPRHVMESPDEPVDPNDAAEEGSG